MTAAPGGKSYWGSAVPSVEERLQYVCISIRHIGSRQPTTFRLAHATKDDVLNALEDNAHPFDGLSSVRVDIIRDGYAAEMVATDSQGLELLTSSFQPN